MTREELRATIWSDDTFVEFDDSAERSGQRSARRVRLSRMPRDSWRRFQGGHRSWRTCTPIVTSEAPVVPTDPPVLRHRCRPPVRRLPPVPLLAVILFGTVTCGSVEKARAGETATLFDPAAVLPFRPLNADAG